MAKQLSSPDFLKFLLRFPNSILIIEDAENILCDRADSSVVDQAVANLLNISDGLLGDGLHVQIIATFNCDVSRVDTALLRKGRLIARHEFGKLDVDSARRLTMKLGVIDQEIVEPETLAEIYHRNDEAATNMINNSEQDGEENDKTLTICSKCAYLCEQEQGEEE